VPAVPAFTVPIVHVNGNTSTTPPPGAVTADEHSALLERFTEAQNELQRMRALLQAMPDPSLGDPARGPASTAPSGSVTEVGLRRRGRARSDASDSYDGGSTYAGGTTAVSGTTISDDFKLEMPEGVPLQVVIMVALGVFVMTYLFF
jgi:vesicle-associated membrane protein-associated protein A